LQASRDPRRLLSYIAVSVLALSSPETRAAQDGKKSDWTTPW